MVAAVCLAAACIQSQPIEPTLPPHWYGVWVGILKIVPEMGEPSQTSMKLEIAPLKGTGRYTFRITYGIGETAQERNYELVPLRDKPFHFEIDEKNGIKLGTRLHADTLYATFQVGGSLIQSRYARRGDVLRVEMVAVSLKDAKTTRPKEGGAEVKSHSIIAVQSAELKRLGAK